MAKIVSIDRFATASALIGYFANPDKLPLLNFALLRERVSISSVLEHMDWHPKSRRGAQWRGACPFHEANDPKSRCFAVHTQKKVYCCHGCGCEGNVLDLWIARSGANPCSRLPGTWWRPSTWPPL